MMGWMDDDGGRWKKMDLPHFKGLSTRGYSSTPGYALKGNGRKLSHGL